ncbi:MAG: hypothetical protein JW841_08850 [Deltaproteobacteria bacterium]|nr:hypothetical protein [Deltaproteobacteria bacterium]
MEIGIAYNLPSTNKNKNDLINNIPEEFENFKTVEAIAEVIDKHGHRPRLLGGGRGFVAEVMKHSSDLVFNFAKGVGTRSREAHIPAALEMLEIPFTHSDPLTLAVAFEKAICKRVINSAGVSTSRYAVIHSLQEASALTLTFPLMIKPLHEELVVDKRYHLQVTNLRDLVEQLEYINQETNQPVIVEEFCNGPEFVIGIIGSEAKAHVIGIMEIVPKHVSLDSFIYYSDLKQNHTEQLNYVVPTKQPKQLLDLIAKIALDAYRTIQCRDIGKVVVRLDSSTSSPVFIKIDPLPGFNPKNSDIVILAQGMGISYEDLITEVIKSACERYNLSF